MWKSKKYEFLFRQVVTEKIQCDGHRCHNSEIKSVLPGFCLYIRNDWNRSKENFRLNSYMTTENAFLYSSLCTCIFIYFLNSATKSVDLGSHLDIRNNFNRGLETLSLNFDMIVENTSLYSYPYTRISHLVFRQFLTKVFKFLSKFSSVQLF